MITFMKLTLNKIKEGTSKDSGRYSPVQPRREFDKAPKNEYSGYKDTINSVGSYSKAEKVSLSSEDSHPNLEGVAAEQDYLEKQIRSTNSSSRRSRQEGSSKRPSSRSELPKGDKKDGSFDRSKVRSSGTAGGSHRKKDRSSTRKDKTRKLSSDEMSEQLNRKPKGSKRKPRNKRGEYSDDQAPREDRNESFDASRHENYTEDRKYSSDEKYRQSSNKQSMYSFKNQATAQAFQSELAQSIQGSPFNRKNMSHKSNPNLSNAVKSDKFGKSYESQQQPSNFQRTNRFYQSNPDLLNEQKPPSHNKKVPLVPLKPSSRVYGRQHSQQSASYERRSHHFQNDPAYMRSVMHGPSNQHHSIEQPQEMPQNVNSVLAHQPPTRAVAGNLPNEEEMPPAYNYYKKHENQIADLNQQQQPRRQKAPDPYITSNALSRGHKTGPISKESEDSELAALGCFHPNVNRLEAERSLRDHGRRDGSYLLRRSQSPKADIVLSVLCGSTVKHFLINRDSSSGQYYLGDASYDCFNNLTNLLIHTTEQGIDDNKYRVVFPLMYPINTQNSIPPKTESKFQSTEQDDGWFISAHQVRIDPSEVLGSGRFGIVYQGMLHGNKKVAVKTIREVTYSDIGDLTCFSRETEMLKNLRHPRLVKFYGITDMGNGNTGIIMEFLSNGNLLEYLWDVRKWVSALKSNKKAAFAIEISEGMEYLESQRVVHRDLAARNILLSEDMRVKIADFGFSRVLTEDVDILNDVTHTPLRWMAPESILQKKFSSKSDVWSYGILLLEIYTLGDCPYPDLGDEEVISNLMRGNRAPCPKGCPQNIYNTIMVECWHPDPTKRPSFASIMHLWSQIQYV